MFTDPYLLIIAVSVSHPPFFGDIHTVHTDMKGWDWETETSILLCYRLMLHELLPAWEGELAGDSRVGSVDIPWGIYTPAHHSAVGAKHHTTYLIPTCSHQIGGFGQLQLLSDIRPYYHIPRLRPFENGVFVFTYGLCSWEPSTVGSSGKHRGWCTLVDISS